MFHVTVYGASMGPHVAQPIAGLYELHAAGLIDLEFARQRDPKRLLFTQVASGELVRSVCFDMSDGGEIDRAVVGDVDVYFKRMYRLTELCALPERLRRRVAPFGLSYGCTTDRQLRSLPFAQQLLEYERNAGSQANGVTKSVRRLAAHPLRWLAGPVFDRTANAALDYTAFEAAADTPVRNAVIFMTRVWDPDQSCADPEDRRALNATRVEIVQTLRRRLGDRFFGGIERDEFSQRYCPDCVVDLGAVKSDYVRLMKSHLIGVATTGLHGSIGWKMAEYVAAARCIISEPIPREAVPNFVEGHNYLEFRTADECASACERLLADSRLACEMRRRNEDYYRGELAPATLMLRRLQTAMALEPS